MQREAPVDDDLRLGPRDERARVRRQRQPPEAPVAEHVGERLAAPAPGHQLTRGSALALVERTVVLRIELDPREPERPRDEMLGVEPRGLDAALGQVAGRAGEHLAERHRSSARRCSSAVSASVKSSSEPASTCSSGTFTFTRWSVTRLCGKL